jgi:hypothetical protein
MCSTCSYVRGMTYVLELFKVLPGTVFGPGKHGPARERAAPTAASGRLQAQERWARGAFPPVFWHPQAQFIPARSCACSPALASVHLPASVNLPWVLSASAGGIKRVPTVGWHTRNWL